MPSSYTTNIAIEKPADGEQSNTWGTTVNDNMDIVDRITSQVGSIALTSTTYTLTTSTSGALSEGHYSVIKFTGTPGGTCTVTISPNTIQRIYTIINTTNQTVTMTQGSGGNVSILAGDTMVVYSDGAGSSAAVVQVFNSQVLNDINITNSTINSSNIGASTPGTGNFTTLSLNSTAVTSTAAELNIMDGVTATTAEINILDGVTATTAEINILDGVTATTAEINILDGVTATTTELNYTDGVTSNIQTQLNAKQPLDATLTGLAGLATGSNKVPYSTGTDTFSQLDFKDEDNMASNSATAVASQQSIKAYVDTAVAGISVPEWTLVTSSSTISSGIITITGLGSYSEIIVVGVGLTSGNAYRYMQVGYSSGSSWITSNVYTDTNANAAYGIRAADGTDGSSPKRFSISITGFNKTWAVKPVTTTATTGITPAIQSSTAFDSIRVYTAAGDGTLSTSSLSGGTIYVFGRT